ncbi:MAG: LysR family transcriptional regulator [Treponema sp.]|nr:LysR family transcriptional regulator [Treponema sp.]
MDLALLRLRSAIFQEIRNFFDGRGYLEVDTPLLAPDLIPESCLEVFETSRLPPRGSRRNIQPCWLIPSPEIWMKKIIAGLRQDAEGQAGGLPAGIYQICHCFRNGESSGRHHSPEFTMLEYYSLNADYRDSIGITEDLFTRLLPPAEGESPATASLRPPFTRISVEDAFARWAGLDLYRAAALPGGLEAEARRLGLDPAPGLDRVTLYDLIFVDRVEPALPKDRPVILSDYPAFVPCLARQNGAAAERWELYARGIELANCYTEETDPQAVRDFFTAEAAAKERSALVKHRVDNEYWKIFLPSGAGGGWGDAAGGAAPDLPGFPPCSGVALGLDRLLMVLTGAPVIDKVLPFPME